MTGWARSKVREGAWIIARDTLALGALIGVGVKVDSLPLIIAASAALGAAWAMFLVGLYLLTEGEDCDG